VNHIYRIWWYSVSKLYNSILQLIVQYHMITSLKRNPIIKSVSPPVEIVTLCVTQKVFIAQDSLPGSGRRLCCIATDKSTISAALSPAYREKKNLLLFAWIINGWGEMRNEYKMWVGKSFEGQNTVVERCNKQWAPSGMYLILKVIYALLWWCTLYRFNLATVKCEEMTKNFCVVS
jgi:hypothetical protein